MAFCCANRRTKQQRTITKLQHRPNQQQRHHLVLTLDRLFTHFLLQQYLPQRLQLQERHQQLLLWQRQQQLLLQRLFRLFQPKSPERATSLLDPVPRAFGA